MFEAGEEVEEEVLEEIGGDVLLDSGGLYELGGDDDGFHLQHHQQQQFHHRQASGDAVDDLLYIPHVDSAEMLFSPEPKSAKMVGPYIMGDKIGEGSYGKVKGALDTRSLRRLAVKIMKNKKLRRIPNGQTNVKKEIRLLKQLSHPNLITLVDVLYNTGKQKIYLVMEYCLGNLQEILDTAPERKLPVWQAHSYFVQLIDAMDYLHSHRCIHRDIKPGNMLLAGGDVIKLSDFGVADILDLFQQDDSCSSSYGTPPFQSPEVARGLSSFSGTKVDIWAAGVTLWNMTTGTYPFEIRPNIFSMYSIIAEGVYEIPDGVSPELHQLLEGMLDVDPDTRFTIDKIRHQPWITFPHPRIEPRLLLPPDAYDDPDRGTTVAAFLTGIYGDLSFDEMDGAADAEAGSAPMSPQASYPASSNVPSPIPTPQRKSSVREFFSSLFS